MSIFMRTSYTQGERERERERETEEKEFLSIPPDFDLFICFLLTKKIRNGVRTLHSKSLQEGKQNMPQIQYSEKYYDDVYEYRYEC